MTTLRFMAARTANPANFLAEAAAMSLRARGTALRSQAIAHLAERAVDAARGVLVQFRHLLAGGCGKAPCAGC